MTYLDTRFTAPMVINEAHNETVVARAANVQVQKRLNLPVSAG